MIYILTFSLTFLIVTLIQLWWWIPRNGFTFLGECVNHFGEPYSCNVIDWVERGFLSLFAWPAVLAIIVISYFISKIILKLARQKLKSSYVK
jgi:Zn-dependent protease with chaperone function